MYEPPLLTQGVEHGHECLFDAAHLGQLEPIAFPQFRRPFGAIQEEHCFAVRSFDVFGMTLI
jgi:hypothetical protein